MFPGRREEAHGAPEAASEADLRAHSVRGKNSGAGARSNLNKIFPCPSGKHRE